MFPVGLVGWGILHGDLQGWAGGVVGPRQLLRYLLVLRTTSTRTDTP